MELITWKKTTCNFTRDAIAILFSIFNLFPDNSESSYPSELMNKNLAYLIAGDISLIFVQITGVKVRLMMGTLVDTLKRY